MIARSGAPPAAATSHKNDRRLALYAALHRQEQGAESPYELRLHYPLLGIDEVVQLRENRPQRHHPEALDEAGLHRPVMIRPDL